MELIFKLGIQSFGRVNPRLANKTQRRHRSDGNRRLITAMTRANKTNATNLRSNKSLVLSELMFQTNLCSGLAGLQKASVS
jgi:hypothetical protein